MQSCAIMNKRLHKIRVRTEASAEMENGMEQKSGMQMIPLDTINGFPVRPGFYLENGAMALPGGVNFTVFSHNATAVWLLLFRRAECDPYACLLYTSLYSNRFGILSLFFSLPRPLSQRLPEMNWRPPEKRLMVSRQLLVQPLHLAIEVS